MKISKAVLWAALALLVIPMFGSYFFDDMFSSVSHLFRHPETLELGWDAKTLGDFIGDYSLLCVCGGLIVGGVLLDVFGVRRMGTVFVAMMVTGAFISWYGVSSGLDPKAAVALGRIGRMMFGLGSEIAGVAVTRSIAKWFRDSNVSLAMGLQLAIARLGTAMALILAPFIVGIPKPYYSLADTSRPALVGLMLLFAGIAAWVVFVGMDRKFDVATGRVSERGEVAQEDKFRFSDIFHVLRNPRFLMIGLLCVTFYCCVSSFKKFGTAVVIPRFGIADGVAGTMVAMIPFFTIVFTPLFGAMVDKVGKATRWMVVGSLCVLAGHCVIAFAPQGQAFWGYLGIAFLGTGYSLVPSAMWPSVPKIIPEKNLGTAYSLIYWIQNVGLFFVPKIVGKILSAQGVSELTTATRVEWLFVALALVAVSIAALLVLASRRHPEIGLDRPSGKVA